MKTFKTKHSMIPTPILSKKISRLSNSFFSRNDEAAQSQSHYVITTYLVKMSTQLFSRSPDSIFFWKSQSKYDATTVRWFDANHLDKVGTRTLITTHHYRWTCRSTSSLLTFTSTIADLKPISDWL